jgi:tRNA A37 threonylcarbamoyladenosine dehydratase
VYSTETVDTAAVSEIDSEESFQRGRVRLSLGSISYMPAVFGLVAAHEAMRLLINRTGEDKEEVTDFAAGSS